MKVLYIGTSDGLAEPLIESMGQEGNDVYIVSDKEFRGKRRSIFKHRFYRTPRNGESFGQLLHSISPECVIFAGNYYMSGSSDEECDADVELLSRSLRVISGFEDVKFILLSSTDVYGYTVNKANEQQWQAPANARGIRFTREEQLLDIYRRQYGVDAVVLRASQLYDGRVREGGNDFLSSIFTSVVNNTGGGYI